MANLNNYYAIINQEFAHHIKVEWLVYKTVVQPPLPDPPIPDEYIGSIKMHREEIFKEDGAGVIGLNPGLHAHLVLLALWNNPQKVKQYLDGKKLTTSGLEDI